MTRNPSKLYHANARRREAEQQKIEQTASVNRYYDKWGRITSRFENWTNPEYYQQADEALHRREHAKLHQAKLERRRQQLRQLLDTESQFLATELKEKTARNRPTTSTLRNINAQFRAASAEKRRVDLEAQLYRQWRHSAREDAILHDSKSDHEALAKMNWLDRQVAAQAQREADQRADADRSLRLHAESRRHLECLADRREQRDRQIAELKRQQERQVAELKQCTAESERLRGDEQRLRRQLGAIEEERAGHASRLLERGTAAKQPYSTRRIKVVLRQRATAVCAALLEDCALLERLLLQPNPSAAADSILALRENLERALGDEKLRQQGFDAMYDSEAKHLLAAQELQWAEDEAARSARLQRIVGDLQQQVRADLAETRRKQCDLVAIRETELRAVQVSAERLKELMGDQRADELTFDRDLRAVGAIGGGAGRDEQRDGGEGGKQRKDDGCWAQWSARSEASSGGGSSVESGCIVDSLRRTSLGSESSGPRFGRKKIAWT